MYRIISFLLLLFTCSFSYPQGSIVSATVKTSTEGGNDNHLNSCLVCLDGIPQEIEIKVTPQVLPFRINSLSLEANNPINSTINFNRNPIITNFKLIKNNGSRVQNQTIHPGYLDFLDSNGNITAFVTFRAKYCTNIPFHPSRANFKIDVEVEMEGFDQVKNISIGTVNELITVDTGIKNNCDGSAPIPIRLSNLNSRRSSQGNLIEFEMAPNPFHNSLLIIPKADVDEMAEIKIYDALGKLVLKKRGFRIQQDIPIKLNLFELKTGLYYICVSSKDLRFSRKIIKE